MWPNMRRTRASRLSTTIVDTVTSLRNRLAATRSGALHDCVAPKPSTAMAVGTQLVLRRRCNHDIHTTPTDRRPWAYREKSMLTAEGCRARRQRLWQLLNPPPDADYLLLNDPIHLMYLANFWVDPISLGAGFPGYLLVRKDGHAKLLHDNRLPKSVNEAHVEEKRPVVWYDGQAPAHGPRQLAVLESVNPSRPGL